MMALTDALNSQQLEAVEELRVRLKSALAPKMAEDPLFFYRFLKARDFDVDKAEAMIRKHLIWRKAYQVDHIMELIELNEFVVKYLRGSFVGFDKEGCIVRYSPTGNIDIKDVMKCVKMSDYMKHCIWFAEQDLVLLKEENEKSGRSASQVTFIFDLDNLSFSNVTNKASTELFLKLTHLNQDNYPERMKALYIINAPAYFTLVFSVVKRVMSGAMLRKIHVFGQSGWQEELQQQVDASVLPAFLGGERTDPDGDPRCPSFIFPGGKVPEKYHLSAEQRTFASVSVVRRLVVPQLSRREVPVEVSEPGSRLQWAFQTASKDVGFGLFFGRDLEELLPVLRYDTSDGSETGRHRCRRKGTYVLVFDNSYSWVISKELLYAVSVLPPED